MRPGTTELLDKAERAILAAETLRSAALSEFAVGRAYYAMFHTASALLFEAGETYSKHSAVIAAYGHRFAKSGELDPKYHRWLMDSQESRLKGDYSTAAAITDDEARELIEQARELLGAARAFLAQ